MGDVSNPKSGDYVICPCRKVTRRQVEEAIREKKYQKLRLLCEGENIGNKCGGCREMLDELLEEIKAETKQN